MLTPSALTLPPPWALLLPLFCRAVWALSAELTCPGSLGSPWQVWVRMGAQAWLIPRSLLFLWPCVVAHRDRDVCIRGAGTQMPAVALVTDPRSVQLSIEHFL